MPGHAFQDTRQWHHKEFVRLTHEIQVVFCFFFNDLAGLLTRCERLLLVRRVFLFILCDDTQLFLKQFGHQMRGADSLGKTLMLRKIEGKRRG